MTTRSSERGSIMVVLLLAVPMLTAIVLYVVRTAHHIERRADLQDLADVAALEGAAVHARTLNALAIGNAALLVVEGLAAGTFLGGHAGALGFDALVITLPEGIELHVQTQRSVEQWRGLARQIAAMQDALGAAAPWVAAAAVEIPVAADPGRGVVIPWPLQTTLPLERHGLPLDAGAAALQATAEQLVHHLLAAMGDDLDKAVSAVPAALCRSGARWTNAAGKRLLRGLRKAGRDPTSQAGIALCRARELLDNASLPRIRIRLSAAAPGDLAGFPMPLALTADYGEHFQIATAAVRQAGHPVPAVALAQARARSLTQRGGGALLIPDFVPRLVAVTAGAPLLSAVNLDGRAPWALQH